MIRLSRNIQRIAIICFALLIFSHTASAVITPDSTKPFGLGSLDFELDSVGETKYWKPVSNKYSASAFESTKGKHTALTVAAQENGNKYLQFKDNGAPTKPFGNNPYWQFYTNKAAPNESGYYVSSISADTYDFLVFDFELMADAYVYSYKTAAGEENKTTVYESIPADAEILCKKPAYPEQLLLINEISALETKEAEEPNKFSNDIKLVPSGSDWCLYAEQNGVFFDTGSRLKNKIQEWNHFTIVIEIERASGNVGLSKQHIYLNGDLVTTQLITDGAKRFEDFAYVGCKVQYSSEIADDARYLYSFGLDNFNVNYYMRGVDGSDYSSLGYGLDDYFKDGNADKGIYNCTDIVYDNNYAENSPVAILDGENYYSINSALSALQENSTLTLLRSLEGYTPAVKNMTVVADASLKFSLSADAVGYTVEKSSENGVDTYIITYTEPGGDVGEDEDDGSDKLLRDTVFEGAKYNLTTTTSFIGNFYVKAPSAEADYEIYTGEGSAYGGMMDIDGITYYKFCSEPLINDITSKITFTVKAIAHGETVTLTAEYTIDEYFAGAMAHLDAIEAPTDYELAQMQLVMNATRYANELYKYVNESENGYAKYEEILLNEAYAKNLTSYSDLGIGAGEVGDFSEISSVVVGGGLAVHSGYNVSYVIYVKDSLVSADAIRVTYRSIFGETLENSLYPTMIEQILEGEKYYCFICRDVPIYEMLAAQTISIKDANGETLTGEYTLGAYVKKHADSDAGNLAKAMYAYAKSSYKYKISAEE